MLRSVYSLLTRNAHTTKTRSREETRKGRRNWTVNSVTMIQLHCLRTFITTIIRSKLFSNAKIKKCMFSTWITTRGKRHDSLARTVPRTIRIILLQQRARVYWPIHSIHCCGWINRRHMLIDNGHCRA